MPVGKAPGMVFPTLLKARSKLLVGNYCVNRLITFVSDTVVIIKVDGELGTFGTPLTVTVSYDYKFLIPGLIGLGTTLQMSAETMMRMERALSPS